MRRILCAANRYLIPEDESCIIVCGRRHWDDIMRSQVSCFDDELWNSIRCSEIQGFIDTEGNFLTREEAFTIAIENNQIIHYSGWECMKRLYSENLY